MTEFKGYCWIFDPPDSGFWIKFPFCMVLLGRFPTVVTSSLRHRGRFSTLAQDLEPLGLAPEEDQLLDFGLPTNVMETLLNFHLGCNRHCQDLVHCPLNIVLTFLQTCFFEILSPSTLRNIAAIAANYVPVFWSLDCCTVPGS